MVTVPRHTVMCDTRTMTEHAGSIPERIRDAFAQTWVELADGGTWWTAAEQIQLAEVARAAFAERFETPWMRPRTDAALATAAVDPTAGRAVVTLAADARTIDRDWVDAVVAELGDAAYVELVAIAAALAAIDAFAEAIGDDPLALPTPSATAGTPPRVRPGGMGDAGAYVDMALPWSDANVARALTLTPTGNRLYRRVGMALYHDGQFLELDWDRPLSRPQTEVLATAVSAANECFY